MTRAAILALVFAPAAAALAAPVPAESKVKDAYGAWADPDKDCEATARDGKLRIAIPAKPHSMNYNAAKYNAPRLWREVEGDFTAVVRVGFPIPGGGGPFTETNRWAYHGAGLIAWAGDDDHVRVLRQAHTSDKQLEEQFTLYLPYLGGKGGKMHTAVPLAEKTNHSAYLRVERRGDKVATAFSYDKGDWQSLGSATVGWGAMVKVGVVAENNFNAPFEATFDQYELTRPKK